MAFTGGYTFKHFEGAAEPVLRDAPLPERITVSFRATAPVTPRLLVAEGSSVRAGEPLFVFTTRAPAQAETPDGDGGRVFLSPVSGAVEKTGDEGITVRSDGDPSFVPVSGHPRAPWHMNRESALDVFHKSGCFLLFDGRFFNPAELDTVRHIIVNAVHNGPLDRGWKPDAFGGADLFLDGIRTLKILFPGPDITIAANRRNRAFFETPEIAEHASIRFMSDRHPQELPELLARDIHGITPTYTSISWGPQTAPGATDPSVLVTPFEDVIGTAECMTRGRPLIDRIVLVAGPGVSKPGWYRIRIGTPFSHISRHLLKAGEFGPWRIIRGGILTGSAVTSPEEGLRCSDREIAVIREHASRDLYRFLNPGFTFDSYSRVTMSTWLPLLKRRLDSSVHGGVRPCVQCNFCDEVCPVGIYPHLIWKQVSAGFMEESFRLRPCLCVGCGLCDYVCPSKIDISGAVRSARAEYFKAPRRVGTPTCGSTHVGDPQIHTSGTPKEKAK